MAPVCGMRRVERLRDLLAINCGMAVEVRQSFRCPLSVYAKKLSREAVSATRRMCGLQVIGRLLGEGGQGNWA